MKRCVFVLSLLLSFFGRTQEFAFQEYGLKQGLPQSQVRAINQDQDGFLWLGTFGGLARFDGKQFDVFGVDDGLLSNRIIFISFFGDTILVGHDNGISFRYKNEPFSAVKYDIPAGFGKFTAAIKMSGKTYISSNGAGLFLLENNTLQPIKTDIKDKDIQEEFNRIRSMLTHKGKAFFGTREGVFYTSDFKRFHQIEKTDDWNVSDLLLLNNQLIVGTYTTGVYSLNLNENSQFVSKKVSEENANLLYRKSPTQWDFIARDTNSRKDHPPHAISSVFLDSNNMLWFGTEGKGLFKFLGYAFRKIDAVSDPVMTVVADESSIYFGLYKGGLISAERNKEIIGKNLLPNEERVWVNLYDTNKNLYFGTSSGLIKWSNGASKKYTVLSHPNLPDNKISALHEDAKGTIWIGTKTGLAFLKDDEIYALKGLAKDINNIRAIHSKGNELYIATKSAFFLVNIQTQDVQEIKDKDKALTFSSLAKDFYGNFWVGTEEGLYFVKDKALHAITYSNQSASKFVNFIVPFEKTMYVGTNNGVYGMSMMDKTLKEMKITHYNESYGLTSSETNLNAAYMDPKGLLWFGTSDGLFLFAPENINRTLLSYQPKLLLDDFQINYLSKTSYLSKEDVLQLKHNENRLRFVFRVVDLHKAESVQIQYYLEGLDADWSPGSSIKELVFNQLAPGSYKLHVRAFNGNESFSNPLVIAFVINKPYYATWWFIMLLVLFLAFIVFSALRLRVNQVRTQETQDRLKLSNRLNELEKQSLNASMNRHFIFNALNSIQFFINSQDKRSANKYLTTFAQLIRKNLDSSAFGVNSITLSEEIQRLELYLSLESMRFDNSFSYAFQIAKEIDAEELLIPPMLFQPFIENAIIHGVLPLGQKHGKITFSAYLEDKNVVFKIQDNGVGYSNSMKEKDASGDHFSHGTTITKSRIEVIKQMSGKGMEMIGPQDLLNDKGEVVGTEVFIKMA
jgi:ligand-binding sensor domain-containing protein/signal transduction histidine kinase